MREAVWLCLGAWVRTQLCNCGARVRAGGTVRGLLVATLSALVVEPLRAAEEAQCARLSGRGAALALEAQCAEPLR